MFYDAEVLQISPPRSPLMWRWSTAGAPKPPADWKHAVEAASLTEDRDTSAGLDSLIGGGRLKWKRKRQIDKEGAGWHSANSVSDLETRAVREVKFEKLSSTLEQSTALFKDVSLEPVCIVHTWQLGHISKKIVLHIPSDMMCWRYCSLATNLTQALVQINMEK